MSTASAQTLRATWAEADNATGYRVYEFKDGEKILLQESPQLSYESEINESIVIGVAAYNDVGESEIIPRLVLVEKPKPQIVKITVEVE